ncbi:transmembrane protein 213 [Hemicordylus capensis]|uniref:transmembrane protein 213 n=1 Tax=Hemicordylus capensis TaxID=884348 RepID=UPI0023040513|nr:transmembrane protein 213 [Hemicordylus capensis]
MQPRTCIAVVLLFLSSACQNSASADTEALSPKNTTPFPCFHVDYCSEAATCCQFGVDDYGWIAAAVGWSLWFITLILLCIDKLIKLRPNEAKYVGA